jgi:signal transduction histidine kinase
MLRHRTATPLQPTVDEARSIVGDLMSRVRTLSLNLRPSILDDMGVLPALQWHFERYTAQTNVQVAFQHHGLQQRFPADIETAIYRIIQEALTNTARYAAVDAVQVSLWADDQAVRIHIVDAGQGFEPATVLASHSSAGLAGMHERVELLNGSLNVESAPGQGTHITAWLPLTAATAP